MVDWRDEFELWWCEWVVYGECELDLEFTALLRLEIRINEIKQMSVFGYLVLCVLRTVDLAFPFEEVVI
jgi:hypothetical protein